MRRWLSEPQALLAACILATSAGWIAYSNVAVTDGPFTETNEVVGGFAQFELKSKEEAVESAVRRTLSDGIRTGDLMGAGGEGLTQVGTDGFRDAVLERLGVGVAA